MIFVYKQFSYHDYDTDFNVLHMFLQNNVHFLVLIWKAGRLTISTDTNRFDHQNCIVEWT